MRNSGSRKRKAEEEEQFVYSDVEIEELETFYGFVDTIEDCLVILQACRTGILNRVTSRLSESQRVGIRSGSVFVFNETESHIKRWTDGRTWSPSRVLGQFLIYRELQRKNPITVTTEVVRDHTDIATVPDTYVQDLQIPVGSDAAPESGPYSKRELRNHERPDYNEDGSEGDEQGSSGAGSPTSSVSKGYSGDSSSSSRAQTVPDDSVYELSDSSLRKKKGFRSSGMDLATLTEMHMPMPFLGAAASMFTYKSDGLIKKTVSVSLDDVVYHVVSYYTLSDLANGVIRTPRQTMDSLSTISLPEDYVVRMGKTGAAPKKRRKNSATLEQTAAAAAADVSYAIQGAVEGARLQEDARRLSNGHYADMNQQIGTVSWTEQTSIASPVLSLPSAQSPVLSQVLLNVSPDPRSTSTYTRFGTTTASMVVPQTHVPTWQQGRSPINPLPFPQQYQSVQAHIYQPPQQTPVVTQGVSPSSTWLLTNPAYPSAIHSSWTTAATALPHRRHSSTNSQGETYVLPSTMVGQTANRVLVQTPVSGFQSLNGTALPNATLSTGNTNFIVATTGRAPAAAPYPNNRGQQPLQIQISPSATAQACQGIFVAHPPAMSGPLPWGGIQHVEVSTTAAPTTLPMQNIGMNLWTPRVEGTTSASILGAGVEWSGHAQHHVNGDTFFDDLIANPFNLRGATA